MAKKRIDTSGDAESLSHNPFGDLGGLKNDLPEGEAPAKADPKPKSAPYAIEKSRKGNWRIAVERRAGGKSVTILSGVSGDTDALLRDLKKQCATGGKATDDSVELQGDQSKAIEKFLSR